MAKLRALAIFQGRTLLPEDRYVNTFHFSNLEASSVHIAQVGPAVRRFYLNIQTASSDSIGESLASSLVRDFTINVYNLDDLEPREPTIFTGTLPASNTAASLPPEMACVLSLRGAPPVTARRRGRLFIGPLNAGCYVGPTLASNGGLSAALTSTLREAAGDLRDETDPSPIGWCIRSTVPAENFVPIVGGWTDNEPDFQHRRGQASFGRTEWGL